MQFFRESHGVVYSVIFAAVLSGCGGGGESVDGVADTGSATAELEAKRRNQAPAPAPAPEPAPAPTVESQHNTTMPNALQIVDDRGATWTVANGVISRDGQPTISSEVTLLLYFNKVVYQKNSLDAWWKWDNTITSGNPWVASPDPRGSTAPAPAPSPAPAPAPAPVGVKLTDFGGNCNGSFDNNTAIANGIAAARAQNVPLLIPAGQCNFSRVIELSGAKIQGEGPTSVLYATNYQQASIFMRGAGPSVSKVKLTGAAAPGRQAPWEMTKITIFGATDFVIDGNTIENAPAASIQTAQGATRGRITNNTIRNSLADSIHMTDGASHITVTGNNIQGSGDDGIAVVSYRNNGRRVHDIVARNNVVLNNKGGRGISVVGGDNVLYENNYVDGGGLPSACLYLAQEDSWVTYSFLNVTAQRNTFKNCGSDAVGHGAIMVFSEGTEANNGATVLNNDIVISTGGPGITWYGPQTNIRFDNNRITGASPAYGDWMPGNPGVTVVPYTSGAVGYVAP